jgi:hypothetical protein
MKFCDIHWSGLRAAIGARGMGDLVAKSGYEIHDKLKQELESGPAAENFDPLMHAHNAIVTNALRVAGLDVMTNNGCPICFLNDCSVKVGRPENFEVWFDRAADDALKHAVALGKMPGA